MVTKESFVSICWRLIPYWLNSWEQVRAQDVGMDVTFFCMPQRNYASNETTTSSTQISSRNRPDCYAGQAQPDECVFSR